MTESRHWRRSGRRFGSFPTGYGTAVTRDDLSPRFDTAVLDIDGTLIDSVYAHVWSWREAFRVLGIAVATWKIHRAIGMGGDRLVEAVTSEAVERSLGDEVRSRQGIFYQELSGHLAPTRGATDLLVALKARGLNVVLASSGARDDTEDAIDLLEARSYIDATITGDDTEDTKPGAEPVQSGVERVDGASAFVVGDAVWDMQSARRAGYTALGLLTGGIARGELLAAGATEVYEDPAALVSALAEVLDGPR
jgi:HAD superfamily hydrolase (TIGR01549 family)